VVQGNGVVIPARTLVQGVVESGERPGHVKRTSEFRFRFTTLVFPNNLVVPIHGALPEHTRRPQYPTRSNDRTLEPVDQVEKVITPRLQVPLAARLSARIAASASVYCRVPDWALPWVWVRFY